MSVSDNIAVQLFAVLRQRCSDNTAPFLLAIDGRAAAGKTSLAQKLQAALCCPVIHMDDFFLRPEQRSPERYQEPGGNVDRERFLRQVLLPLRQNTAFSYRPFSCSRMELAEPVHIARSPICIIEGCYACHPLLWPYYDLHVFLSVLPDVQRMRILARNGPASAGAFFQRWIPLEERYFSAFSIPERCDFVFEST